MTRYTIGEFSRLTRLTIAALRHYDEIDLFRPAHVDRRTGYRYYDGTQLADAVRLAVLRGIGVPITDLRAVHVGTSMLEDVLARHRARLTSEIDRRRHALRTLEALTDERTFAVTETVVAPARVAHRARRTTWDRAEATTRRLLAELRIELRRAGVGDHAPYGALFPTQPAERFTVVVFAGVDHGADFELSGGDVAAVTYRGPHGLLPLAYRALLSAVEQPGDIVREDYLPEEDGVPRTRVSVAPVRS